MLFFHMTPKITRGRRRIITFITGKSFAFVQGLDVSLQMSCRGCRVVAVITLIANAYVLGLDVLL